MTLALIAGVTLWWASGFASFIYWLRSRFPVTVSDLMWGLFIGLWGPLGFLIGWMTFRPPKFFSRVVISKRGERP